MYVFVCLYARVVIVGVSVFFQAEDGIRDLVRSRGLGDVYKRQVQNFITTIIKMIESTPPPPKSFMNDTPGGYSPFSLSLIHI